MDITPDVLKGSGLVYDLTPGVTMFSLNFTYQAVTVLQIGFRVVNMIEVGIIYLIFCVFRP